MAKIESRVLQVHPARESSTITRMERFGWMLKSNQDVVTKDSHDELVGDTVYSVTETERYVKLMFQRDTEDEKYPLYQKGEQLYDEILELERYSQPADFSFRAWPEMARWQYILMIVLVFFVGGFIGLAVAKGTELPALCISWAGLLILVIAAILFYRLRVLKPKELAKYQQREAEKAQEREKLAVKRAELNALGL